MRGSRGRGFGVRVGDGRRGDEGSATVEFTLVSILVVFLFLAVVQLALTLHVRNTLISSASEGAHLAALADRTEAQGEERTRVLIQQALGGYAVEVHAEPVLVDGASGVKMTIDAPVPLVGLWGFGTMTVEAHALEEEFRG